MLRRSDLERDYFDILKQGLTAEEYARFQAQGVFPSPLVTQVTSGTRGGRPLLIPRSLDDILEISHRIMRPFSDRYNRLPARVALIGGISHAAAAISLRADGSQMRAFSASDLSSIEEYDPELVSCYPSIIRELVAQGVLAKIRSLKGIKLGGERIFAHDISLLKKRFPGIVLIEQLGSTELPALAVGDYTEEDSRRLKLQDRRFRFLLRPSDSWQKLIAADGLEGLKFPIPGYFDSGDEVIWNGNFITEIRRQGDPANTYHSALENVYRLGCINLQLDLGERKIYYQSRARMPSDVELNGELFRFEERPLTRLESSHKMPLLRS